MINLSELLGAVVDLETHAPDVLTDSYKRCKILSILDFEDASRYANINTIHATILPRLPKGTSKDYTSLRYLKIQLNNNRNTVLAVDWIILDNIKKVDAYRRVAVKLDKVSIEEEDRLRKLLISNDFTILEIKESR